MQSIDVLIVGGGPGGSTAGKKCAEHGLKTLILEKRQLPRDKVCSGMLVGRLAQDIVKQEFGEVPQDLLVDPYYLEGCIAHVPGVPSIRIEARIPICWRRDLDLWLLEKAGQAGASVHDGARVTGILNSDDGYIVKFTRKEKDEIIRARFVIGADGATSLTRRIMYPGLSVTYSQCYQEMYESGADLARGFFHFFFPPTVAPYYFSAYHKGGVFLIEVAARVGDAKKMMTEARKFLAESHDFDVSGKLLHRDGCLEPILYRELLTGAFSPAMGNILLVGDAAGFEMPITGEGISTAMKSGAIAAHSVIQAVENAINADKPYLEEVKGLIRMLGDLYSLSRNVRKQASHGVNKLASTLAETLNKVLGL